MAHRAGKHAAARAPHTFSWPRPCSASLGILIFFVGLTVIWFLPILPFDNHALPDAGFFDPPGAVWVFDWWKFSLTHGINPFHTDFIDYPSGVNLVSNASMPLLTLFGIPITAWLGPIASLNFFLELALATSAWAMYLLARSLSVRPTFAVVAGLVYGFGPYMATESRGSAHPSLAFVALPPLILLCLVRVPQKRLRMSTAGLVIGLLAAGQALIDPEALTDLAILLVIVGVVGVAIFRPRRVSWRSYIFAMTIAAAVFLAIVGYPLWFGLFGPSHIRGPVQPPRVLQMYSADLLGPIVPTAQQIIAPSAMAHLSARFAAGNPSESLAYLGLPFVLMLIALTLASWRDRRVTGAFTLAAIAFVLSLGSRLTVAGHVTVVPLPEAVLSHVPLLNSTVPARFALYVALFGALAVALGLERLLSLKFPSRVALLRSAAVAIALLACTATLWPARSWSGAPQSADQIVAALETLPPGSVVLTYPYPKWPYSTPMLWQALADMNVRLIGGYSYVQGPFGTGQPYARLLSPPSVQEFLAESQDGVAIDYPPSPSPSIVSSDLCPFIRNYRVAAILDTSLGTPSDTSVASFFKTELGNAFLAGSNFSLYLTGLSRCS